MEAGWGMTEFNGGMRDRYTTAGVGFVLFDKGGIRVPCGMRDEKRKKMHVIG